MMVDLNVYDAFSLNSYIISQLGNLDSVSIYGSFFEKHKYSKEDFNYTLEYYSNKPKTLIGIYDAVFAELSKKSDELKKLSNYFSYEGLNNFWYSKPTDTISADPKKPNSFDIKIDSVGTYVITAQIKMTFEDESINPRIIAYFYDSISAGKTQRIYFDSTIIFKSQQFREYQVYKKNDNPKFTRLHIILPDRDNKDTSFTKSCEIRSLTVGILRKELDMNMN